MDDGKLGYFKFFVFLIFLYFVLPVIQSNIHYCGLHSLANF